MGFIQPSESGATVGIVTAAPFPTQSSAGAPSTPSAPSDADDQRALILTLVVAFAQDSIYGLFFLSYMNHYLLDVLKTSAGMPAYTLALFGTTKLVMNPIAGRLIDRSSPRLVFRASVAVQVVAVLLLLLIHSLWSFLVAATLLSAGSAAMWPLIYDVIAHTPEQRGHSRATGLLALVSYVALGSGLLAGVLLGHFVHARVVLLLALTIVGLPFLLQGGAALAPRGRKMIAASGIGPTVPLTQSLSPKSLAAQIAAVASFGLIVFIDYMAVTSIAGLYGPYARLTLHISLLKTAVLLSPAGLVALV